MLPGMGSRRAAPIGVTMPAMTSWWLPKRPARVPGARAAGLLAGLGAVLFGTSAVLLKTGAVGWDLSLFRFLNEVPPAVASVLTPLVHLFLPIGIVIAVVLIAGYVVAWTRSVLPLAAGAAAAGAAWALANAAKVIANRPRPYQVVADAVLRQPPAHGTSFPSSHTAVTMAVVIALVPFLPRALAWVAIAYAVLVGWSRVYPIPVAASERLRNGSSAIATAKVTAVWLEGKLVPCAGCWRSTASAITS